MSPTSSRNRVPWCASSKRPTFWPMAPVKAPFSWPNSSLSRRPVGMAAQLSLTKVRSRRGLRSCRARATSSLPVPVSPRMRTVESVGATVSTCLRTRRSAALSPTISPKLCSVRTSSSRYDLLLGELVLERLRSPGRPGRSRRPRPPDWRRAAGSYVRRVVGGRAAWTRTPARPAAAGPSSAAASRSSGPHTAAPVPATAASAELVHAAR